MLNFDDLVKNPPPLKKTVHQLKDGREYILYDLPAYSIDSMFNMTQENNLPIKEIAVIVAHALLGHKPQDTQVEKVLNMGSDTLMEIFKEAIGVSSISDENIEKEKKSLKKTTGKK